MPRPPATLRESLAAARRAGENFSTAWLRARSQALRGAEERSQWKLALDATQSACASAYACLPASQPELALALLGEDPERDVPLIGDGRVCPV